MWPHDFAARANAHYHRPDDRLSCCDLHDLWYDETCPECDLEEMEERHERALVEAAKP